MGRRVSAQRFKRTPELFTVVFHGLRIFGCKTAQLSETQREWLTTEAPSIRETVQRNENTRKTPS